MHMAPIPGSSRRHRLESRVPCAVHGARSPRMSGRPDVDAGAMRASWHRKCTTRRRAIPRNLCGLCHATCTALPSLGRAAQVEQPVCNERRMASSAQGCGRVRRVRRLPCGAHGTECRRQGCDIPRPAVWHGCHATCMAALVSWSARQLTSAGRPCRTSNFGTNKEHDVTCVQTHDPRAGGNLERELAVRNG